MSDEIKSGKTETKNDVASLRIKLREKLVSKKMKRKTKDQQREFMCKKMGLDKTNLEEIMKQLDKSKHK